VSRRDTDTVLSVEQPKRGPLRYFLSASAISGLGDGIRFGALPLLAVTLTQDPLAVAGTALAKGLPWLLFSLPAGALADRWNRRRMMIWANVGRAVLAVLLAGSIVSHTFSLLVLYVFAFGLTTLETLADNAGQALVPSLVEKAGLARANGRLYAAQTAATQFVGPPLGSALFAVRQSLPVWLDAVSFAAGALLLTRVKDVPLRPAERPITGGFFTDIGTALRWLLRNRLLRTLAVVIVVDNVLAAGFYATLVLFATRILHLGAAHYGFLMAAYAVGALTGSLVADRLQRLIGRARAIVLSIVLFGAPFLAVALFPDFWLVGALLAVVGLGEAIWGVLTTALRQAAIPPAMLGRVMSAFRLVTWTSASVGALAGGMLASYSLRAPALLAGVLIPFTAVAVGATLAADLPRRPLD
jgi:MFS family permease